jgi:hypothetical protein
MVIAPRPHKWTPDQRLHDLYTPVLVELIVPIVCSREQGSYHEAQVWRQKKRNIQSRICNVERILLSPTLIPLSGVGTCLSSCCENYSAIVFTTGLPKWVLTTANAAGTNSLKCLPKHGGARDNKFCSPIQ